MFSSEVKVSGEHVKGSIKLGRPSGTFPRPQSVPAEYLFHSDPVAQLERSERSGKWTAQELRDFAAEIMNVAAKVDELNGIQPPKSVTVETMYAPGTR
jgi:hypothetical protein